ncbi:hypothetical protein FGRMN_3522 [Fusarium graminum]|nr:hypothetical protein FGRMN_3522 [Fusarium graminum]
MEPNTNLPIEIILLIIEHLTPDAAGPQPILPAVSIITKSLLAWTTVSRATYPIASRLIWQNCLYIDSRERIDAFREFVSRRSVITGRTPCEAYGPTRMFLSPFSSVTGYKGSQFPPDSFPGPLCLSPDGSLGESSEDDDPDVPYEPVFPEYVSDDDVVQSKLHDLQTVQNVREVLLTLAPVLKTLVVDMPLRSLYPEDDHQGVRKLLREGFEALAVIEDIVSVEDELYLATIRGYTEPQVWTLWPKLKRIALYNIVAEEETWQNMLLCPQLKMGVFTRADSVDALSEHHDVKREWSKAWTASTSMRSSSERPYQGPQITMAFCNQRSELPDFEKLVPRWHTMDPENRICILTLPTDSAYHQQGNGEDGVDDPRGVSQEWIRNRALAGTLWGDVKRENVFMSSKREQEF